MTGELINLGDLSKPATVLIEKISDAVGGIFKPWQIKRVAGAEAEAEVIRAQAKLEISEIEQRALLRMLREEGQKQENIESITAKAIPHLQEEAKPENIDKDWLTYFFDKSRLTSDAEMQSLWAGILAGQANASGRFSKKTIDLVSFLEKRDAALFTKLCKFAWVVGSVAPLIFHANESPYKEDEINFATLTHLDSLGLITFNNAAGFQRINIPKYMTVFYYGRPVHLEFSQDNNSLEIGHVMFTQAGAELASICGSNSSDDFFNFILDRWFKMGITLSMPIKVSK